MNSGIIAALCLSIAFALLLYRLHRNEERLIAAAGFVPVEAAKGDCSAAAERFVGRDTASVYEYGQQPGCLLRYACMFKHTPYGDEPSITSLVVECDAWFGKSAVIHKLYGSHLLFRALKKTLIRTGDLGIEGESLAELEDFNESHFSRYSVFALGEPGFDTRNPAFRELAGVLARLGRKSVASLGISGRYIVAWSADTAELLKLWEKLRAASALQRAG